MNRIEAEKLVLSELVNLNISDGVNYELLQSETIEAEWGWVFFYQSYSAVFNTLCISIVPTANKPAESRSLSL